MNKRRSVKMPPPRFVRTTEWCGIPQGTKVRIKPFRGTGWTFVCHAFDPVKETEWIEVRENRTGAIRSFPPDRIDIEKLPAAMRKEARRIAKEATSPQGSLL